jgi:alkanesulfonate monooxygenase SsuD/methylene tetrahydromethanopterin reductase-like flavin-dependent oxidoreductase (luciferase family)
MSLTFGVFDHIEPVPGLRLDRIYRERLLQIERLDRAGFSAYHLAEHHTPAIHSLAPSQNVFLGAVAQRTTRLRFGPCVYVLPLHHPLRLIEEISMLDHLSGGRLEIGVGRGGVMEASSGVRRRIPRRTTRATSRRWPSSARASATPSSPTPGAFTVSTGCPCTCDRCSSPIPRSGTCATR